MTDRRSEQQVRDTDPPEAHERIDQHVRNDAMRWKYLAWSVIMEFVVICVLSTAFLVLLGQVRDNTNDAEVAAATAAKAAKSAQTSICIEIAYLDAVSIQSRRLIVTDPNKERLKTRLQQLAVTERLIALLKQEVDKCDPIDFGFPKVP